ncbi:MAG: hypothetical protein MUP70_13755, partial [Candidatus Aminicenantes bacterium]|nr:hypothetical protein [Candidatus Aminicenantes bacterium]
GHEGESHGPERLRYSTKGWRELVTWGNGGYVGPLAVPGTYSLLLKAGEEVFEARLDVLKDPHTTGSLEDIKQQVDLALAVRDDLSELAKITVGIEWLRRQIDDMVPLLKEQEDAEDVIQAVDELDQKCITVEKDIFQLTLTGTGADDLRGPTKLYSKLMSLAGGVQSGDFPPTLQQKDVFEEHHLEVLRLKESYTHLITEEVSAFNTRCGEKGLFRIITLSRFKKDVEK